MNEDVAVVLIIFMAVVAPIWIVMHYRTIRRRDEFQAQRLSENSEELVAHAEKLEQRVEALETILDEEVPGWRKSR